MRLCIVGHIVHFVVATTDRKLNHIAYGVSEREIKATFNQTNGGEVNVSWNLLNEKPQLDILRIAHSDWNQMHEFK